MMSMPSGLKKLFIALLLALSVLSPAAGLCEDARIDDVKVSWAPSLKASFEVKDAFSKEIEEAIKSGMPTSFNFIIELERVNSVWFNELVGRWEFKHTVKYDTLKEEYEVILDETGEKNVRTKDMNEMKALMATGSSVAVTPAHLVPGADYELKIKAELRTTELPFILNYMLFFVKIWDFKTDWYSYSFRP